MKENVSGCFFLNTYSVYTEENRDIFLYTPVFNGLIMAWQFRDSMQLIYRKFSRY